MFQKVAPLFNAFKVKILAVKNRAAGEEEVKVMINYYINLGYFLDGLFQLQEAKK
jgi:hypothetical protein